MRIGIHDSTRPRIRSFVISCVAAVSLAFTAWTLHATQAAWVHYNSNQTALVYSNDIMGNRLPDFSFAGYGGGGVAIPTNMVVETNLSAVAGDNTPAIESAINYVSSLTPDAHGFRGVVLLNPGVYEMDGTLTMGNNGVVLRGSGDSPTGTVLHFLGASRQSVTFQGSGSVATVGSTYTVVDNYVPLGATNFHVSSSSPILWGTNTTIAADSDIFTNGTLLYAYNWSGTNQTVNGVTFTGTSSANPGNVSIAGIGSNYHGYSSSSAPFSSLSVAYQNLLCGGEYSSGTSTATLTLNNLTAGHVYAVQFWVSDPRGGGTIGRTETVMGSNEVVLAYNVPAATGGVGQYSIGVFTATGSSQSFSFVGSASTQINALLVSDVTTTGYQPVNPPGTLPPSAFNPGQTIIVQRPVTQVWINAIGMSNYWTPGGGLQFERTVTAVSSNQITVDIPLCNPIEQQWCTGLVYAVADAGRMTNAGIENLRLRSDFSDSSTNWGSSRALNFDNCKNCWFQNIIVDNFYNGINSGGGAKWCTVQDCSFVSNTVPTTSAGGAAYGGSGQMVLWQRCGSSNSVTYHVFVTQAAVPGPNVFLNFNSIGSAYDCGAHQRWAAGALFDDDAILSTGGNTGIKLQNRAGAGSGQGYGAGYSLIYNGNSLGSINEIPQVSYHYSWAIGGAPGGTYNHYSDDGIFDATNGLVNPRSLYLEQLRERLGGAAIENIGYSLFTISAAPSSQVVTPGGNVNYSVTLGDPALMSNVVALAVSGLPANCGASFNTNTVTGAGAATLTVTASNSVVPGTYTLNVIGANAGLTHTSAISLVVGSFSLTANPLSQTVLPGNSTNFTLTVTTNSNFSGSVNFGLSGLPSGANATFSPTSLTGNGTSTLTVATAPATPPGIYPLTVYGTNGNVVGEVSLNLTVAGTGATPLWNGGSASGNYWSDSLNWSGVPLANDDALIFDGGARLNNTNDTTFAYSNIVFNPGAGAFVLNGNAITLTGNITNESANPQTIDDGLNFAGNFTFDGAGNTLSLLGGLTNTAAAPGTSSLSLAGNGQLSDLWAGGTNQIAINDSAANWTIVHNAAASGTPLPWYFEINVGTFNFGTISSAPVISGTTTHNAPKDFQIANNSGGAATFNMVNGTLTLSGPLNTATTGNSTSLVNQVGGTLNLDGAPYYFQGANGGNAGEVSTVTINGGTMNCAAAQNGSFYVASRGNGSLTISGSAALNCGTLDVSRNASGNSMGSVGVVNLDGGTITCSRVGTATANFQTNWLFGSLATFNFNGGTLRASTFSATFYQGSTSLPVLPITSIVQSGGAIIDSSNFSITVLEPLQHDPALGSGLDGGLTKPGTGSLTLTAVSTYNGDTLVNAGTLQLSGNGSISDSDSITVGGGATFDASTRGDSTLTLAAGQTLTGNGTVKGTVVVGNGATLAPGGSLSTLVFSNNVTLNGGSTTVFEVSKSPTTNDFAQIAGTLTLAGTIVITNVGVNPYAAGDSFRLFSAAGTSGQFTNIQPAIPALNLAWNTNNLGTGTLNIIAKPTPPPNFSSVSSDGKNITIRGTGGVANWNYYVLTSTNIVLPLADWSTVSTNSFDGSGSFIFSNTIGPNAPQLYYLLKLQ